MIAIQRRAVVDEYRQFSFQRGSVAFDSRGRLYYPHQARFESVNGRTGVLVEEGTQNKLPNPTWASFNGWNMFGLTDTGQTFGVGRILRGSAANGTQRVAAVAPYLPVLPNVPYTLSVLIRKVGLVDRLYLTIEWRDSPGAPILTNSSVDVAPYLTTSFQRFTLTATSPSNAATAFVRPVYDGGQTTNCEIEVALPQLEEHAYATSWTNGTRAAETLTVPTAGVLQPQEATVEFWAYVNAQVRDTSRIRRFFSHFNGAGNANRITIQHNNTPFWLFTIADANGNTHLLSVPDSTTPDGWHYFAMVWSGSRFAVFIDGVKRGELLNPTYLPQSLAATFDIGHTAGAGQPNTYIGPVRISRRARTDQEIADAYAAGTLAADADTTLLLPFTGPDAQRGARTLYVPAVGL